MNRSVSEFELVHSQPTEPRGHKHKRICIVTAELAGPFYNGGIGTANRALALVLRKLGYDVDVLYTRVHEGKPFSARGTFADHVEAFRKFGIGLVCIDQQGGRDDWQAMSYLSLQHLLRNRYDLVFFDDLFGTAYYPLLARRTGNVELRDTRMCIVAHAPLQWIADLDQVAIKDIGDLRWGEMERRCSELADVMKAPSAYILGKYRSYGWTIPKNSIVMPNFISAKQLTTQPARRIAVREIVFFGRLETRKGLWMFCRALDHLKFKLSGCRITFLGKVVIEKGISTAENLLRRSTAWPFPIRLLTNFDQEQALAYLKKPGRLAVIASPEDNSPSTILECLEEGIPFLACSGSGGEELLDEESRKANLFEPSVNQLCAKLLEVFESGATTARPSFDHERLQVTFAQWLNDLLSSNAMRQKLASGLTQPVLIVIVPREFYAGRAAAELERTVRSFEGNVKIQVLAAEPKQIDKQLASSGESLSVNVAGLADFGRVAQSLASEEATVVGLCHITQLLSPAWVARARVCFAVEKGISALTGMVAIPKERDTGARAREPYVSIANEEHEIERYLMGYAPPLFAFAQETNSGFVLMRSSLLAKCSDLGPVDEQYNRLKRMQDWIHEILVTLHSRGERFEMVPDLVMEQPVSESEFEVFRLESFMRSLPSKLYGYRPGSDQSVLARLAIDLGLERERSFAHAEYIRSIADRIGAEVQQLPLYSPWEEQARQLAMIAHAGGQIDLAFDLCAELAVQDDTSKPLRLTEYIRSAAAGKIVNLVEALAGGFTAFGQENKEAFASFLSSSDRRKIEMHAIATGPTGFILPCLNLANITHFTSVVAAPERTGDPIRFRIELISHGKQQHWSAEKVVYGGEENLWEFECPQHMRAPCTVRLGVEIANWQASKNSAARWINPRFIWRS